MTRDDLQRIRADLEEARTAGLKARHRQRLARALGLTVDQLDEFEDGTTCRDCRWLIAFGFAGCAEHRPEVGTTGAIDDGPDEYEDAVRNGDDHDTQYGGRGRGSWPAQNGSETGHQDGSTPH